MNLYAVQHLPKTCLKKKSQIEGSILFNPNGGAPLRMCQKTIASFAVSFDFFFKTLCLSKPYLLFE